MTPQEKINVVESQVKAIRAGIIDQIDCPYCSASTMAGRELCCPLLKKLTDAILECAAVDQQIDLIKRVQDRVN